MVLADPADWRQRSKTSSQYASWGMTAIPIQDAVRIDKQMMSVCETGQLCAVCEEDTDQSPAFGIGERSENHRS